LESTRLELQDFEIYTPVFSLIHSAVVARDIGDAVASPSKDFFDKID